MRLRNVAALAAAASLTLVPAAGAKVLRVGTYKGIKGQYKTIQAAVAKAKPDDWILIGPGDYKTAKSFTPKGHPELNAGVLITTRDIYIRGMNRNSVVVDGTKPGSATCSSAKKAQNFGPKGSGLNGILVWNASNVWVQNLTACNFLGGTRNSGNEIWWDAQEGTIGHGMIGSYLNATSTYFDSKNTQTAAEYGIFSSRWSGGTWDHTYASNFNDSGYYIGACKQVCNQTINHGWAEFSALGYSGSNSGGKLVVENSEFDNNQDGFDTNSQNGDNPPPQNGACPNNGISPITHTHSCWVFMHNFVHDNNNPNVPALGSAAQGPVGTGMSVSGGRNDTIINNRFVNNNAWGIVLVPYLDSGKPCTGGIYGGIFGPTSCGFPLWGIAVQNNLFSHNGSYGHPSNGDLGWVRVYDGYPTNCFSGNKGQDTGLSPDLQALEVAYPSCTGAPISSGGSNPNFLGEVLCNSQVEINPPQPASCPTGPYPRRTEVVMHPLPKKGLTTMPNPCVGVPHNPWCPARKHSTVAAPVGLG